jgi:transposase
MEQTNVKPQFCIGIDLGDRFSHFAVLDRTTGEILEEGRIPSTPQAFERRFCGQGRARIALEVGSHSRWASELLERAGHEVIVANAYKVSLITRNDKKSDRVDAMYLARLAGADPELLHPLKHRSRKAQVDRCILIARDRLVGCRTKLINSVRGMVKATGARLPRSSSSTFHTKVRDQIAPELKPAIDPLLKTLAWLNQQINKYDKLLERKIEREHPAAKHLMQVDAVGPITSLNFVLTVDDPGRFKNSRTVGSYVGLRPKERSSGKGDPELRISKAGDSMLRRHLVQSAQRMLGPFGKDSDLRRWGLQLASRGGKTAKKRAVVAVARKLAVLLHRLWVTGAQYEPLRKNASKDTALVRPT